MDETPIKLTQLFDEGFAINEQLKDSPLSTNDKEFQDKVLKSIKLLEESTQIVNELSLFSSNESIEEISTQDMKYLLLPAVLADLTLKSQNYERMEVIKIAEIYYRDFIQRLNDYQICDIDMKPLDNSSNDDNNESEAMSSATNSSSLESAARLRNDKIKRYNEGKELDNELKQFRDNMSKYKGEVDDEILRQYYTTLLKRWINYSLEELNGIESEKEVLKYMTQMKAFGKDSKRDFKTKSNKTPLKPMIITKNEFQKKVYGLGYPSIPTVSIDEFINQKIEEGSLSITNPIYNNNLIDWAENPDQKLREDELEEERKEILIEKEDEQNIRKAREWDDWKDDHKRGEGNRKNMG